MRRMDYYDAALRKLKADTTSMCQLERDTGVPWETIRDIKYGRSKRFYYQTVKKIAAHYFPSKIAA
jgi:hypothetical protein